MATLNTACIWSKKSAKKNIVPVARAVTFEDFKFWGMEEWRKLCKESTHWMRSKDFPVGVDDMARCYFSVDFCASSSSCCCIIVASSPSLMIIFSLSSRFCTLSHSIHCLSKANWESRDISMLSSGGIYMAIAANNSWVELIYTLFGIDLSRSIFVLFLVTFEATSKLWDMEYWRKWYK